MSGIEDLIKSAESTLGWSDEDNTKKTPVHVWYEDKWGAPDLYKFAWDWCAAWVTYVAYHSGNQRAMRCSSGQSYNPSYVQAFKANGEWREIGEWRERVDEIRRGDVVFFDWRDGLGIEHVGIATGPVEDGKLPTIEGNTLNTVAYRSRKVADIAGYGRPAYASKEEPVHTTYTPPAFPAGLRPDSAKPSARGLQAALKAAGYLSKSVAVADNYGPSTQAAVAHFHKSHPALSEDAYDPEIGPKGWAVLHHEAYGSAKPPAPVTPAPPASTPTFGEPPADYRRLKYGGKTVNVRTQVLLRRVTGAMGLATELRLTQGSYNSGVSASAGTHDGGGVVDVDTTGHSVNALLRELRKAGFAAWYRTPAEGFAYHIHACAIGDREMSSGAHSQVNDYFRGLNGLANRRADSAPASVGRPYPQWAAKYR